MTDTQLLALVLKSRLLTEQEKSYWKHNMPKMNTGQKARLEAILTRAQKISWNEHIQKYMALIGTAISKRKLNLS